MESRQHKYFALVSKIMLYASIAYIGSITLLGLAFMVFGESFLMFLVVMLLTPIFMLSLPLVFLCIFALLFLGSFRKNDEMIASSNRIVPEVKNNFFGWMMTGYVFDFRNTSKGDITRGFILPFILPKVGIFGLACLYLGSFFVVSGITGIFDVSETGNLGYVLLGVGILILLPFYLVYKVTSVRESV